ncbi:hypothetical protein [Acrocarpospora phusangensis]|uniref:hypothetical protein n=1 Tax=Acrocarpospora phusangensis TaxID=1070424 RepID=UPI00194EB580|nr:hypothetical protein [Acrocarpospora phusangensis]
MSDDADTRDRLTRIEGKIDLIGMQHTASETVSRDHEERIRAIERWKYALPVSALGALVAAATALIAAFRGGAA